MGKNIDRHTLKTKENMMNEYLDELDDKEVHEIKIGDTITYRGNKSEKVVNEIDCHMITESGKEIHLSNILWDVGLKGFIRK